MLSFDPDQEFTNLWSSVNNRPACPVCTLGRGLGGRPIRRAEGGAKLKKQDEVGQLTQ